MTAYKIAPLSAQFEQAITEKINQKTKPLGALGRLESLALQLAKIQSQKAGTLIEKLSVHKPSLFVFVADHGIAAQGVSIAPSEVTQQMVVNFATGGAAVNVFCRQFGWDLSIVDAGMLQPVATEPKLQPEPKLSVEQQRLGKGTNDFSTVPAMSQETALKGLALGHRLITERINNGADLIAFGEMGIGNTSSAAAIMAAVLSKPASECVGAGTGIDAEALAKKQRLIQQALDLHQVANDQPIEILSAVGGFEIAQICGGMLAAAESQVAIVVDGFICTAAAMLAKLINPNVCDYFIFAHCSDEQGHRMMLDWFEQTPLLTLGMRLGEGSGAALALPIIQASMSFYNEMASFEQAKVEDVVN